MEGINVNRELFPTDKNKLAFEPVDIVSEVKKFGIKLHQYEMSKEKLNNETFIEEKEEIINNPVSRPACDHLFQDKAQMINLKTAVKKRILHRLKRTDEDMTVTKK